MTYLIIKKLTYASSNFRDDFSVVNQTETLEEAEKYLSAYKTLKREDENIQIVEFAEEKKTVSVKQDENFDFNQLELPFGVSSI